MDILIVYETLKSYGIDIPGLSEKIDDRSRAFATNPNPNHQYRDSHTDKLKESMILVGDVDKQREFLRGELYDQTDGE